MKLWWWRRADEEERIRLEIAVETAAVKSRVQALASEIRDWLDETEDEVEDLGDHDG